jgi:hypothetical protein
MSIDEMVPFVKIRIFHLLSQTQEMAKIDGRNYGREVA